MKNHSKIKDRTPISDSGIFDEITPFHHAQIEQELIRRHRILEMRNLASLMALESGKWAYCQSEFMLPPLGFHGKLRNKITTFIPRNQLIAQFMSDRQDRTCNEAFRETGRHLQIAFRQARIDSAMVNLWIEPFLICEISQEKASLIVNELKISGWRNAEMKTEETEELIHLTCVIQSILSKPSRCS